MICFAHYVEVEQILPKKFTKNTIIITTQKTGELGKSYFYCSYGEKYSTEQVVREYYKNSGYQVIRAEYSFWKGIFVLAFFDELYPQTLNLKAKNKFFNIERSDISTEELYKKLKEIKKSNIQQFINNQIAKHEQGSYIRWLDKWGIEGYKNSSEYFKSSIVQEFLTRIDNKTFCKILKHTIDKYNRNPVGTTDYIVWDNKEMIFIEVKRKNETLKPEQIEWGCIFAKKSSFL